MGIILNKIQFEVTVLNKVMLIGNLVKDAKYVQMKDNIRSVIRFTLAVDKEYLNKEGKKEADFIDVAYWTNYADKLNPYLVKGKKLCVTGRLITRSYFKEDGTKKYVIEVEADNIDFLGNIKQA